MQLHAKSELEPYRAENESLSAQLLQVAEQLVTMASELSAGEGPTPAEDPRRITITFDDRLLAANARAIYRARQRRDRHFAAGLFGEPAWDMLLELFVQTVRGARISTTSLCLAAGVAPSTGLRWISNLERAGLLQRHRVPDDRRVSVVELTPEGYRALRAYLSEGILRHEMPVPDAHNLPVRQDKALSLLAAT